ncbi:hypothetical protein CASFOL_006008 [Castilleja foliolosa]|uniref:DUF6821 domain-containing protein n=1 Tax=Castilleja foliolosa TaxID=1961234 RepID=A0ABD3E551_9LAMI
MVLLSKILSSRGRSELSTSGASHSNFWLVSFAAAVMGFAILARRLYKMKKKTMGLEIKVFVDDKKISQVMSRAARLNEAFLIVIRVLVIRPSLPAVGSTNTWPVGNKHITIEELFYFGTFNNQSV